MAEYGIFNDEGCLERGLYGDQAIGEAVARYNPDDQVYGAPMCGCGTEGCECEAGECDCNAIDDDGGCTCGAFDELECTCDA